MGMAFLVIGVGIFLLYCATIITGTLIGLAASLAMGIAQIPVEVIKALKSVPKRRVVEKSVTSCEKCENLKLNESKQKEVRTTIYGDDLYDPRYANSAFANPDVHKKAKLKIKDVLQLDICEGVSICAYVDEQYTSDNGLCIKLIDPSGQITAVVSADHEEVFESLKYEIIEVTGQLKSKKLYLQELKQLGFKYVIEE